MITKSRNFISALFLLFLYSISVTSCAEKKDIHSFANIDDIIVTHIHLNLVTDFGKKILKGSATLSLQNLTSTDKLTLDSRDLNISKIVLDDSSEASFSLGPYKQGFGQALTVTIKPETKKVIIFYSTSPSAMALQWLDPEQTLGKNKPFLFSQSESIYARSWLPCQDTPRLRITYTAKIKTDPDLLALMSASNPQHKNENGVYSFEMTQPIPTYLMAIAIGDLEFRSLGPRSGVYAEKELIDKAAFEFSDTEHMLTVTESLYGPYLWERYDILVLPPSFPFGGMENPRLTFVTPTLIAGDKSLVSTIAHEIAHSWSGNLVTNAGWDDFWLNEGFTSYIELRILEELYGAPFALMNEQIAYQSLKNTIANLGTTNPRTKLYYDLTGKHPDDASDVAYDKGARFLRAMELAYGREKFDDFLKKYFSKFAFQTMTSEKFINYLNSELIQKESLSTASTVKVYDWIYNPGLPDKHPIPDSPEFRKVDVQRSAFIQGRQAKDLNTANWTTQHWLHFIKALPPKISPAQMEDLDNTFQLTSTTNAEIAFQWYVQAINNNYREAYPAIENYLTHIGRIILVKPIYQALLKDTEDGKFAEEVYQKAKPGYHPLTRSVIEALFKANQAKPLTQQ
jgi:leukotriene-A4 hydrolase